MIETEQTRSSRIMSHANVEKLQTIGRTSWTCGPTWLHCRRLGKHSQTTSHRLSPSTELIQRLGQEASLDGHRGCVNCLEWNQSGKLLASGSDDSNVIIWDVFRRQKQNVIKTGHEGTIFSVKFMPDSSDSLVATCAGDGQVKVTDIYQSEKLLNCNRCHTDRVKRLAVHPHEPNLIWSAAEDGLILEYDTRLEHICNGSKPNNVLIDLRTISNCLQAKCIAVNPVRSEMLAVGSNDVYSRIFDRRFIKASAKDYSNTVYFAPGHLLKTNNRSNHIQTYGITYLSFNNRGTELLASYHAEQVYLFNVLEPWERFKTFDQTIKPILLDGQKRKQMPRSKQDPSSQAKRMRRAVREEPHGPIANASQVIQHLNNELTKSSAQPFTYCYRSEMLLERGWRGDHYQALRDCCHALAIDPMDSETIYHLAKTLVRLRDLESVIELANFMSVHKDDYMEAHYANMALDTLNEFIHNAIRNDRSSPDSFHPNYYGSSDFGQSIFSRPHSMSIDLKAINDRYKQSKTEAQRCSASLDYSERYCGHCNMNTDIKEANFFGPNDEFIVGGSDDGAFYIWDKETSNIIKAVHADHHILNCVQPHPTICMLATSGIETAVKFWSPIGPVRRDVKSLEARCTQNQKFISTDPLEAMIMMLYPDTSEEIN